MVVFYDNQSMYFCSHVSPFFVHLIQIKFNLLLVSGNVDDNQSMNFWDPRVNFFSFFSIFQEIGCDHRLSPMSLETEATNILKKDISNKKCTFF